MITPSYHVLVLRPAMATSHTCNTPNPLVAVLLSWCGGSGEVKTWTPSGSW